MKWSGQECCVVGKHGLIGSALANRLGDVTSFPTRDTKVLFHFGSYTHPEFNENPHYLMKQQLDSFAELLPECQRRGIIFVYPSSALVYEKDTTFSLFKKTLEQLAGCYETRTLGLRIFPVYGPGEDRTVISQWCRQVARGEQPVIYGDGEQTRDFIYIDDVVDQILFLVESVRWKSRVTDVGTGIRTSFNSIIETISDMSGKVVEPKYISRPVDYSDGIVCGNPLPTKVSIREGVADILDSIGAPVMSLA